MSRWSLLALALGLLLIAAPFTKMANGTADYEDDGEDDDDAAPSEEGHQGFVDTGDDEPVNSSSDVMSLTAVNFESILKKHKYVLVEFYAPWCHHCRQLAPHYEVAATALKSFTNVVIAKVDATKQEPLVTKYGIQGYPTLKWFVDGDADKPFEYTGGRDDEGIIKWIKKRVAPPTSLVPTPADLADLEKDNAVLVLGYFEAESGEEYDQFILAAQKVEDSIFIHTTSADVAAAADLEKPASVALIKNFHKLGKPREVLTMSDTITADALKDFIDREKLPITIEFTTENADRIFNSGIPKQIIVWSKASDLDPETELMQIFVDVANKFKGQLVFVTSNNEEEHSDAVTNYFDLKNAPSPSFVAFHMSANKKWKMLEEFSQLALEDFAAQVIAGTYKAAAEKESKSADVPIVEEAEEDGVVVIVGKNVDKIVKDTTRDVLLEVYAPWCGHCKTLAPIYKQLAKRFSSVDSVVIAKMDGEENEHPDIKAEGYPSLMFFPAGDDQTPIPYEGGRTLLAMTKFIKKHAKVSYELPKKSANSDEDGEEGEKDAHDEL